MNGYVTKTFAPFIGLALPAGGATCTITYSPPVYSDTALALLNSQNNVSELRYTWTKPGSMATATLEYDTRLSETVSFGVWLNYNWMLMRSEVELEFEHSPDPPISRSRDVTATMTKYILGGGVAFGLAF